MNIINVKNLSNLNTIGNNFLELDLDLNNISKILLQLLYYKEHNIKKFILRYDYNLTHLPIIKVIQKLKMNKMYKMVKNYNIVIGFKGIPRCIFEKFILNPRIKWYFEGKIFYVKSDNCCNNDKEQLDICEDCMYNQKCDGICIDYLQKFGKDEFKPLIANSVTYPLFIEEVNKFQSEKLKEIAYEVLDNFKNDKYYMRKRFVFVKSFPNNLEESSRERFIYYIFNKEVDFTETLAFIKKIFNYSSFFSSIEKYLQISNQLVISCEILNNGKLRKSFYFNINDLNEEEIKDIFTNCTFEIKVDNLWGLGIDFTEEDELISHKLYYDYETLTGEKIKELITDTHLENKKMLLKFINSLIKPLNNVLINHKYMNNDFYSKKIDISLHHNNFRLNQFALLFNINMSEFIDKDLITLSFEISNNTSEKINFYYTLKSIDEEEDEHLKHYRYYAKDRDNS